MARMWVWLKSICSWRYERHLKCKVHLKTRSWNVNIHVCILTFNSLVFMNSRTVCLFWKEKSSYMDGFFFHLVFFFTKNWKVFIPSILMKTVKTLRSSAVTYISEFADQPVYRTFLSAPLLWIQIDIKHFVWPGLGQTCLLIVHVSAADKGT